MTAGNAERIKPQQDFSKNQSRFHASTTPASRGCRFESLAVRHAPGRAEHPCVCQHFTARLPLHVVHVVGFHAGMKITVLPPDDVDVKMKGMQAGLAHSIKLVALSGPHQTGIHPGAWYGWSLYQNLPPHSGHSCVTAPVSSIRDSMHPLPLPHPQCSPLHSMVRVGRFGISTESSVAKNGVGFTRFGFWRCRTLDRKSGDLVPQGSAGSNPAFFTPFT